MPQLIVIDGNKTVDRKPAPRLRSRSEMMRWLAKARGPVVMMLIAPADLRGVNRLFGLEAGDALIMNLRRRLSASRPKGAVIARFPGCKTGIALPCPDSATAAILARKLRDEGCGEGPDSIRSAVRIGAAWVGETGPEGAPPDLIVEGALSAYDGTSDGGVSLIELDRISDTDTLSVARRALNAIRSGDIHIALQPVVSSDGSGQVLFREALLRLRSGDGGEIPAGRFMPALDKLGMTEEADIAAMRLAFDELMRDPALRISVNLSGASIRRNGWPQAFEELAASAPDAAERLIVEVTEEAALSNASETAGLFTLIRARGAALAIDDFGAGRTSFSHLRDFRFDMVKIDGDYIRGIDQKPDNRMLVSALVAIARQFDMMVIAEHVETAIEARALRALKVDGFQGFLFGRPALVWSEGVSLSRSSGRRGA